QRVAEEIAPIVDARRPEIEIAGRPLIVDPEPHAAHRRNEAERRRVADESDGGLPQIERLRRGQVERLAERACAERVDDSLELALEVDTGDAERGLEPAVQRERMDPEERELGDLLGDDEPFDDIGGPRRPVDVDVPSGQERRPAQVWEDRKSTRLNSSHVK